MTSNVIIRSDERKQQVNQTLSEYGIDPTRASASQRELAEEIAHGTNQVYSEMRRYDR